MYTAVQQLMNCSRKFNEMRATRWLLLHLNFTKFNFGPGPEGAYDAPPDP